MRYEDASLSGSFQDQGPVARDDTDQLAAGDRGPATGNVITGAGTQTGASGADSGPGARVTSVSGAGGQDNSFAAGQLRVEGEHGTLSVTARGDYVYRANAGVPENSRDTFNYTLSDATGAASQARLIIEIGKTQAVVAANAQRVVPGPDGVVVLPAGVELSDIRIVGRDLLIMLPDGSQMLIVDGAVFVPQLVINDIEVPSTNLAALLIEQEPRPASGVPQSSGGNFANPVGPLDPGTPLGDLLPPTQLEYTPPEFEEVFDLEDLEPEVGLNPLIQMDDDVRAGGNAGGTGDDPDAVNTGGILSGSGGDGQLTFALLTTGAPAGFTYVAGQNGTLLVQQNGTTVLTVTVNAQTGAYSVVQNAPVLHANGADENNVVFTFGYTVTDRDGDSATGSFQVNVDDDTPTVDVTAGADAAVLVTTDDFDTRGDGVDSTSSSANFSAVFGLDQSVGADGPGTAAVLTYALGTAGGASGLTQGGVGINLYLVGGKVIGSTASSAAVVSAGNTVFDVSVSSTGVVTLTQYGQIDHAAETATTAPFNDQFASLADGLVTLTGSASITDRDGDTVTDSAVVQIGANIRFTDDGPSLTGAQAGAGVTLDETQAGTPSGFPISATSESAAIVAGAANFGADGPAASNSVTYAISVVGDGATTLRTALGDFPVTLVQAAGNSNVITGTYDGGKVAFTVTINANGTLTVSQNVPLEHNVDGLPGAAHDDSLDLSGLINATVTVRDFDGDTASASAGIGGLIVFRDDGPDSSLAVGAARNVLVLDETLPEGSDTQGGGAPGGLASVTAGFADNFAQAVFGADGAGSVAYSLVLSGRNVGSGLHALQVGDTGSGDGDPTGRGAEILLNQTGNVITGSVGGVNYFTISIDPATGAVTFTQLAAVWNPAPGTSYDEAAVLSVAPGGLVVRQTVTDSDGDTDRTDIDVGSGVFQIQDDGPVAIADLDSLAAGSFGPETGNVLANDTLGRDGAAVVAVSAGESTDTSFDEAGNLVVQGQYGVLTIKADGSYSYVRDAGTRGGVDDVFTYTLRDTDGDTSSATLTIRIGNATPTVNAPDANAPGTVVHEAALPGSRGPNESEGSGEETAPGPNGDDRESTVGTISFTQGDGPAVIRINGVEVTAVNQTIDTGEGTLRIDSIAAGSITYTYTLKDNLLIDGASAPDTISVSVTDQDGQVASDTLVVTIVDDAPVARLDSDILASGSFGPETGHVITGVGTSTGPSGADTLGADGAAVVGVKAGVDQAATASGVGTVIQGQYGKLTLNADGSYSYTRDAGTPGGVTDTFSYTLRDGDNDTSVTQLNIVIGDAPVDLTIPPAGGATTTVFEKGLPARGSEPEGSGEADATGPNGDPSEAVAGTIGFSAKDGLGSLTIANVTLNLNGSYPQTITDTAGERLIVTSVTYDAATGNGSVAYEYTLKDNTLTDPSSTSFAVVVTDSDGDNKGGNLVITIVDDAPDARADTDALAAGSFGPETGNVLSGAGTTSGSAGADTLGADGALVVGIRAGSNAAPVTGGVGTVIQGQYGKLTLNADGSYSYARDPNTQGGVSDVFTYTLQDGDGDQDTATLTIVIGNAPPTVNAPDADVQGTIVYEAALSGSRGPNESEGSGEAAAQGPDGDTREATSGTITFTQGDGPAVVRINGVEVTAVNQTIDTGEGILRIDGINAGSITYTYTLKDNLLVSGSSSTDPITVTVTDQDGQVASDTLVITIIDDAPSATNDVDSVGNSGGPATGNVITGIDASGGDANALDGNADVPGADGAVVVAIASNAVPANTDNQVDPAGNFVVNGQFGQLTIKPDGSYSYVRSGSAPVTGSDVFTYMLRDGDGDEVTATLTINIADAPVTVDIPPSNGATTTVFEAALPARGNEPEGSDEFAQPGDNGDTRETVSGTISFTATDGLGSLSLNGTTLGTGSTFPVTVSNNATGTLVVTGVTFDAATGAGSIAYTYTLKDNTSGGVPPLSGDTSESFNLVVTDSDGDTNGGALVITIRDDAPTARPDSDSVVEGATASGNVVLGTDTTSGAAGLDIQGADGAMVVGVKAGGDTSSPATGTPGTQIVGTYGTLTLNANGSYSYVANANSVTAAQQDVFTYTIRDADGDISTTTLTITVNNVTLTPDTEINSVNEAALDLVKGGADLAPGTVEGSNPGSTAETTSGQLTVGGATSYSLSGSSTGSYGVLQLNANGSYTYTLTRPFTTSPAANDGAVQSGSDQFTYVATDANGNSVTGTITINIIDDVPTASSDSNNVTEGALLTVNAANGVLANDEFGADGPTVSGGGVIGVAAGSNTGQVLTSGTGGNIVGVYGTLVLQADGSYTYKSNPNVVAPAGATDAFVYTIRDRDGDTSTTTLTINISDVTLVADSEVVTVNEAALDTSITGSDVAAGSVAGSNPNSPAETQTGTLAVAGATGFALVGSGTGALGTLVLNSNGSYTYTLRNPVDGVDANNSTNTVTGAESFQYVATDANGNSVTGTIRIDVVDDVPTARPDTDALAAGSFGLETGNVITGSGTTSGNAGADTRGADGASVAFVSGFNGSEDSSFDQNGNLVVNGQYGVLTIKADGSYSYARNPGTQGGASDTFTYRLVDGDGDESSSTLTISLGDARPVAGSSNALVDDDALAGGNPGGTGDIDANAGETPTTNPSEAIFNGQLGGTAGDGASSFLFASALNGQTALLGTETVTYSVSADGLTLTAASGRGTIFTVAITDASTGTYTLTLVRPVLHATLNGQTGDDTENDANLSIPFQMRDVDGDLSLVPGSLNVTFDDDTPEAFSPMVVVTTNGDTAPVPGQLNLDMGADGLGSLTFASSLNGQVAKDQDGNILTVGGQQLTYVVSGNVLTAQTAGGTVGYVVTLNSNGSYTFDVQAQISNGTETTFSNLTSSAAGNVLYRGIGANDPATATDVLLSGSGGGSSQTVNTDSDSIGTANQSMDPGESLRIDLVQNLVTQSGTATGFNYAARVNTTSFEQLIPQVQGSQSQTVSFQVYALNSTLTGTQAPDSDPAGGFSDGSLVAIRTVTAIDYLTGVEANAQLTTVGQTVNVGNFGVTAQLQSDGSVIFSGIQEGDRYGISTGSNEFNAVVVLDRTGSFDLGIFSIGSVSAGTPIVQTLPVIATDADGDSVTAMLTATINPASTGTATASSTARTMEVSSSLVVDNSSDSLKTSASANTNLALMAGLAAGFASMPAAATTSDDSMLLAAVQQNTDGGKNGKGRQHAKEDAGTREVSGIETSEQGSNGGAKDGGEAQHRFAGSEKHSDEAEPQATEADAVSALDKGTDTESGAAPASLFGGGEIHLPDAAQIAHMVSINGKNGAGRGEDGLGSILADALGDAGLGSGDIDQLINAAVRLAEPTQRHQVEGREVYNGGDGAAPAALATPLDHAVSGWDGGDFGPLFNAASAAMESKALHPDAVQPIANG